MEDLPAFAMVTVAVGIFLVSATTSVVSYRAAIDAAELHEEGALLLDTLRDHPSWSGGSSEDSGVLVLERIHALCGEVAASGAQRVLEDTFAITRHVRITVRDVSGYAAPANQNLEPHLPPCPAHGEAVLSLTNAPAGREGTTLVLASPVTLRTAEWEIRAAVLEVRIWA